MRSHGVGVDGEEEDISSTDFSDNLVLSVARPGDGFFLPASEGEDELSLRMSPETASLISDCSTFLIFGIMMGCLLIVASVMMCLLAYRLNTMASSYKV